MGINNFQPSSDDKAADNLFAVPRAPVQSSQEDSAVGSHIVALPLNAPQSSASQPLFVPASSTADTLPTTDVVIRSDTGGEVHARLRPTAMLSDMQDMLWRHFHIDAHTYDLVVGAVFLKPATPVAAQGVTSGCSIMLKPATREFA